MSRPPAERGAGLLSSALGLLVFLCFLFLAVHVLVGLWATSSLTSVAYDAARDVATSGAAPGSAELEAERRSAEQQMRDLIGGMDPQFEWSYDPSTHSIVLEVSAEPPSLLVGAASDAVGLDTVTRTVRVRVEDR